MKSSVKRFLCLMCAVAVGMTMASCKKNPSSNDTSSDEYEIEYVYQSATGSNTETASGTESGTESGGSVSSNTSGGTASGSSSSGGSTTNLAEKYRGTTVTFAAWSDPASAKDVFKSFEKKYGIKVSIMSVPQGTYINTVAGKIASGNAPDVVFDNAFFPASLNILQPITVADTIDLSDPIWDQGYIKRFTFNGKVYEVSTVSNYWSEGLLFFYNKSIFKNAGITTTPEDLYKQGKWNWTTLEQLMQTLHQKLDKGVYALEYTPWDMSASVGTDFFYYDNSTKTIKSGISDPLLGSTMTKMAEWNEKGWATATTESFIKGKAAMKPTGYWALRNNGHFSAMKNKSDIGFTYMPDYDETHKAVQRCGYSRGWGICKGAKNPGAAGLFIRYYLDVNNYDLESEFISKEAQTFFFEAASRSSSDMFIHVTDNVVVDVNGAGNNIYYNFPILNKSSQILTELNKLVNVGTTYANKANKLIKDATTK